MNWTPLMTGDLIGESIAEGRVFHILDRPTHCLRLFRSGWLLACANKITDLAVWQSVERYISLFWSAMICAGEVLIIISNSGRNPAPIDACLYGQSRAKGGRYHLLSHSKAVSSRHSSGKKLYELADLVIDTHTFRRCLCGAGKRNDSSRPCFHRAGVVVLNMMLAAAAGALGSG